MNVIMRSIRVARRIIMILKLMTMHISRTTLYLVVKMD